MTKIDVGESFGVTSSLEKQYHVGELVTLAPDAQFVCIEQAQYYDVLHQGEENRINVLDPKTGEVSLVQEKRIDGLVAIRGTPKALLTNLLEHESKERVDFLNLFLGILNNLLPLNFENIISIDKYILIAWKLGLRQIQKNQKFFWLFEGIFFYQIFF